MDYPQETYPKTYKHIEKLIEHSVDEVCIHDCSVLNMLWKEDSIDGINWDNVIEGVELEESEGVLKDSIFGEHKNMVLSGALLLISIRKRMSTIVDHIIEDIKHG